MRAYYPGSAVKSRSSTLSNTAERTVKINKMQFGKHFSKLRNGILLTK